MNEFGEFLQERALVFTFGMVRGVRIGHSQCMQDMRL
jgi:hypothetical protein